MSCLSITFALKLIKIKLIDNQTQIILIALHLNKFGYYTMNAIQMRAILANFFKIYFNDYATNMINKNNETI